MIVRCAQLGKCIPAKVLELSTPEGGPLKLTGLVAGASLMLDVKGKSYPVTFVCDEGAVNYSYSAITVDIYVHGSGRRLSFTVVIMCFAGDNKENRNGGRGKGQALKVGNGEKKQEDQKRRLKLLEAKIMGEVQHHLVSCMLIYKHIRSFRCYHSYCLLTFFTHMYNY